MRDLSDREVEVLRHLAAGLTVGASARRLFLAEPTVKQHRANINKAMEAINGAHAVSLAYERGIFNSSYEPVAPPPPKQRPIHEQPAPAPQELHDSLLVRHAEMRLAIAQAVALLRLADHSFRPDAVVGYRDEALCVLERVNEGKRLPPLRRPSAKEVSSRMKEWRRQRKLGKVLDELAEIDIPTVDIADLRGREGQD
jgi:DNA-binding CsgD family transcriptional regulator